MAAAATLIPGARYPVRAGEFEGQLIEIVSNVTEPDDSPLRRRIPVRIVRNGVAEEQVYILPRLIHDGNLTPKRMAEQAAAAMAATAPGQAPVIVPIPTNQQESPTVPTAAPAPVLPPLPTAVTPPVPTVVHTEVTVAPALIVNDPITDMMDPRLDAYRPDPSVVDRYIARTFPGGKLDSEVLLGYWKSRQNVLFVGDTQAGKSMFIQVLAVLVARGEGFPKPLPIFTLSGSSGVTDFDMFGQITSYADPVSHAERLVQLDGVVEIAATVGGILELDEVAMLPERVTSSLHPLCDDRRMFVNRGKAVPVEGSTGFMPKITKASPNLWILGAYNDGYRGSGQLQEAFLNRFKHIQWGYEEAIEKQLIASPVIRRMGVTLRMAYETRAISTPVGTKALEGFTAAFFQHGPEYALWEFLGMFPGKDRARAESILEQNTLVKYLADEWEQRNEDAPDLSGAAADPFD